MNFFRRKSKQTTNVAPADPLPDLIKASEKARHRNYFGMSGASPLLLRRRNVTEAVTELKMPAATAIASDGSSELADDVSATTLAAIKADFNLGVRIQRRRSSIMGVAHIMRRRSTQKGLRADADEPAVAVPELAVVASHSAKTLVDTRRERLPSIGLRRTSEESTSGGGVSSSDESSGGDSDTTLATRDGDELDAIVPDEQSAAECGGQPAHRADNVPAADQSLPAPRSAEASSNKSAVFFIASTELAAVAKVHPQLKENKDGQYSTVSHAAKPSSGGPMSDLVSTSSTGCTASSVPTENTPTIAGHDEATPRRVLSSNSPNDTSSTPSPALALERRGVVLAQSKSVAAAISRAGGEAASSAIRPQRRPLSLRRRKDSANGLSNRLSFMNLGIGNRNHDSNLGQTNGQMDSSRRASFGFGRRSVSLSRRSISSLSHSSLAKDAEKRKMDAWTDDDDEFSAYEYDLSGAYFELPVISSKGVKFPASQEPSKTLPRTTLRSSASPSRDAAESSSRGSRLSSTSTVCEENVLSADQCKRVYVSSMRKLQLQSRRRHGMRSVLHIKNAMTKANDSYAVVSGGCELDTYQLSCEMIAEFYLLGGGRDEAPVERRMRSPSTASSSSERLIARPDYPMRSRSMGSLDSFNISTLLHNPRPVVSVAVASAAADRSDSDSRIITAPMSSPPALADGAASIADKVLAEVFDTAREQDDAILDSELLRFGGGNLIPLASSNDGSTSPPSAYRSYRRRRGGGRRNSPPTAAHSASAVAAM
ncbi:hypothetical protein LPJ53_003446 [Coemansia erecta]|uniref:Uncharacterized protein n=1 Tax=Coemansia erecta TaxID=147472 RepID=A0A9W7XW92_9FUNG|nr:hypothetical protein LPJ53_003446 [Coemansia erecta]